MCQAFSCLITKSKKVYWKAGMDSHSDIQAEFVSKDKQLTDDKLPPDNTFARVEITPANKDYLRPNKWVLKVDEQVEPKWWSKSFEKPCYESLEIWKKKVYTFNLEEAINPIHPFKIKAPKITKKHIMILQKWASVRASVRDSVWASVWASVRDSVGASVWDSVWDSVGDSVGASVRDSVRAYTGSLFPIKKWKYCDKVKEKGYPFKSCVDLWKKGLVPVNDGTWYLLGSPNGDGKCEILWKGEIK
jgi:hypothetical protein